MKKVFITGSTTGLGFLEAKKLIADGNEVVLHARNEKKAQAVMQKLPGAKGIVVGDLSSMTDLKNIAQEVNDFGTFDSIIHNAGVYSNDQKTIFKVNVLAPYVLTALITKPKSLIYTSSGMHLGSHFTMDKIESGVNYSASKLLILLLTKAIARKWQIPSNAVDPGWVPTRMGGDGANDDLKLGYLTQVKLVEDNTDFSGKYFYHDNETHYDQGADDIKLQDELLQRLAEISDIQLP
ncbi:SDR family NAD(P)-dependent oxidoreductase [Companilactobacillus alimentarius]|uniref:SDR family NAD(P)-dependent oxidoreductase n=1 Tax=Companilactobacillus alimentarius TaxID=1602 RepID=UPI0028B74CF7|nr:SDR family NAD(P)-dependent oxidoreductase [Companilactobacillus alimentarius]MDT6953449.1 SDR family NAD(P)-dependent oxidoreductase [Companilactobacillus alimentarius]